MRRKTPLNLPTPPPPCQIDDPLDAIAVHAGGAAWGMLGCAAFAAPNMVEDWYGPYPGAVLVDGVYSQVGPAGGPAAAAANFSLSIRLLKLR